VSQKNVPPLVCCNFDAHELILIFFGRNVTDKIIKRRFTMPLQVTCASVLPGNTKIAVFTHCISALPEFNQSLLDFFNLFDSWLILSLLYDSVNLVINAFSLVLLKGMALEKGSREHCSSWTVLHAQSTSALSSGFPLLQLQGNAEALDRWGGKTKHHLISYFLSNISAKNYRSRFVYVKITASQRWDFFWNTA